MKTLVSLLAAIMLFCFCLGAQAAVKDVDEELLPEIEALLSILFYQGEALGVPVNPEESLRRARAAARRGSPDGKAMLGFHYHDGALVPADPARSRALADEAAGQGSSLGMALQALLQFEALAGSSAPGALLDLANRAAEEGEGLAQGLLALVYAFDPVHKDPAAAERFARLAAGQADSYGQMVLGWLYMEGLVVERNNAMAWAYLDMAGKKRPLHTVKGLGADPLASLESRMSQQEKRVARQIQENWKLDWGRSAGSV